MALDGHAFRLDESDGEIMSVFGYLVKMHLLL